MRRWSRSGSRPGAVRVKTFHALGREILADGGESRWSRCSTARRCCATCGPTSTAAHCAASTTPSAGSSSRSASRRRRSATDPEPGPIARAFLAYEQAIEDAGGLDFDDLVARALRLLEARPPLLRRWRERCAHLLVDETQDVDRTQLRLALLLAAPANRIFLVGDDDQTIYGWRLADVRQSTGPGGVAAGAEADRPDRQLPLPGQSWSIGRSGWSSATRSGSSRRSGPGRSRRAG